MRLSKVLVVSAALFASASVTSQSYACINGATQCLSHIVYICQNGYWVITQGVCHASDPRDDRFVRLPDGIRVKVSYSKPSETAK